jgi:hypothetical protein
MSGMRSSGYGDTESRYIRDSEGWWDDDAACRPT